MFVIAILPIIGILREYEAGYQLSKEEDKVNHLGSWMILRCMEGKYNKKINLACKRFICFTVSLEWIFKLKSVL